jgi:hypothetical protein
MNQKTERKMKIERIYEVKFNYKQGKSDPFTIFSAYAEIINSIPIPLIAAKEQKHFAAIVDEILATKVAAPKTDTSVLEQQVDNLVYRLYDLSWEEVKMVEPGFPMGKVEYEEIEDLREMIICYMDW